MLIFTDPGCVACRPLMKDVGRWQRQYSSDLTIAVLESNGAERRDAISKRHGLTNVLVQKAREIAAAYKVTGTPSAVIVSPEGTIATPLSSGVAPV